MSGEEIQSRFASLFHTGSPRARASAEEISRCEQQLHIRLPRSYISFMTTHGPLFTPSLRELTFDSEKGMSCMPDVMEFWPASELSAAAEENWKAGTSAELIPFANDSMGNMFCFSKGELASLGDNAGIHLFDHEFCSYEKISATFNDWLLRFVQLREAKNHADIN